MTVDSARLDRLLQNRDTNIQRSKKIIPIHRANQNFEYEARVANSGIEGCIEKTGVLLRGSRTIVGVPETMRTAAEFARVIRDAVQRAEAAPPGSAWIYVQYSGFALVAAALVDDWRLADDVARSALSPVMKENIGSVIDEGSKLLSAVFRNDAQNFPKQLSRFDAACEKDYFYRTYFSYRPLMQGILERSSDLFMNGLNLAETKFLKRAKDKKLIGSPLLCAGPEYHDVVFDYYATALCKLAKHRGLKVEYYSDIVPNNRF